MSASESSNTPNEQIKVPEALDFEQESLALAEHVKPLTDDELAAPTAFKQWRLNDIFAHLHFFNLMAHYSLVDETRFAAEIKKLYDRMGAGQTMVQATDELLDGLSGRPLIEAWQETVGSMTPHWAGADPRQRLNWVGPTMSVRSSISARLMETWAHGQAIYDLMGLERTNTDRIRSVVVMGVNTFGWTFKNRDEPIPESPPQVRLTSPSGAQWLFHEGAPAENSIQGSAEDFCQVVTQVRHVTDTDLIVTGPIANAWMNQAQCFAGKPNDPPAPGTRFKAKQPWPER
ncbi:MAG: TIGR03084 family metal-binding protein [Burkholderiaceae bacterium]